LSRIACVGVVVVAVVGVVDFHLAKLGIFYQKSPHDSVVALSYKK
jgi:hypothetical protein